MFLWRDHPTGGREGLVLSSQACANPACACREVVLEGWLADDKILGVSEENDHIKFVLPQGSPPQRRVLRAAVDIDRGTVEIAEGSKTTEPWAVEWLRSEMDAELVAILQRRFQAAKRAPAPPHDWRKDDWSWWQPERPVAWTDVATDDDEASEVLLDGKTYAVSDFYCVEPGCACEEVRISFWLERSSDKELEDVGDVWVNPTMPTAAQLHAHGPMRPLLERLWGAFRDEHPVTALLVQRRARMRELAPEIHRLFGKPAPAKLGKVGANEPCPCGSGKKYKRCCKGK